MPAGRPSEYSETTAEIICFRLSEGESLNKICAGDDMPSRPTVYKWLRDYPEFLANYTRAREQQADSMMDDIIKISDEATAEDWTVARLRVQARQWAASKLLPRKYGNNMDVNQTVTHKTVKADPKQVEKQRVAKKDTWQHSHANGKTNGTTIQ